MSAILLGNTLMQECGQQAAPCHLRWLVGIKTAVVWSVFFLAGSIMLFVVSVALSILSSVDFTGSLCIPYRVLSMGMVHAGFIDRENLPGAILLGYLIPWMITGFFAGFFLGCTRRRDTGSCRPAVVYACGVIMVLMILITLSVLV
jgi:hypothetical protein